MCNKSIQKNRQKAFVHQNGNCFYCGSPMWLDAKEDFALRHGLTLGEAGRFQCTAEHLTPKTDGGKNTKENIVAACSFCNHTRHKMRRPLKPMMYKKHVEKRLSKGKWHQVTIV